VFFFKLLCKKKFKNINHCEDTLKNNTPEPLRLFTRTGTGGSLEKRRRREIERGRGRVERRRTSQRTTALYHSATRQERTVAAVICTYPLGT
jgi:hypothetical protein